MSQPPKTTSFRSARGTNSLIFGARASLRLPSRMVPIWVSEPIGRASPFRIANTPAIVVVATAPRPTSNTPSLPCAGATSSGGVTIGHYIIPPAARFWPDRGEMRRFLRKPVSERDPLTVTMSGVRLGERALQIGNGEARSIALIAAKTGLTGTAAIVVADDHAAVRIRRAVTDTGALVDLRVVAEGRLPFDDASFDAVVVHDLAKVTEAPGDRPAQWLHECHRLLRTGGRIVTIERGTPVGLRALFAAKPAPDEHAQTARSGATVAALNGAGFTTVRVLADREGIRFTEGFKTN